MWPTFMALTLYIIYILYIYIYYIYHILYALKKVWGFDMFIIRGSVRTLSSIPYDYKEQNPGLFQVWFGLLKDEILDYYRISWLRILWLCFVHWFNWSICFNVFGCLNLCSLLNYLFDSSVNATHYWIAKNKLFGSIDWIEPG